MKDILIVRQLRLKSSQVGILAFVSESIPHLKKSFQTITGQRDNSSTFDLLGEYPIVQRQGIFGGGHLSCQR